HCISAGDGELREELEMESRKTGAADRIHFIGFQRDVPQLLAGLDLFVQPSLWEGLPVSLIEALAAGKAIVATDIEGNREIVDEGETGLIVPPADSAALATAIISLALNPDRARQFGQRARVAARQRFSEQHMVERVLDTYDRLVVGSSCRATPQPVLGNSAGAERL